MTRSPDLRNALDQLDPEQVRRMMLAPGAEPPAGRQSRRYPSEARRASAKATWDVGAEVREAVADLAAQWGVTQSDAAAWLLRQALRQVETGALTPTVETVAVQRKLR